MLELFSIKNSSVPLYLSHFLHLNLLHYSHENEKMKQFSHLKISHFSHLFNDGIIYFINSLKTLSILSDSKIFTIPKKIINKF